MPNTPIPAAAEGMPKFNRAAIMTLAWKLYRRDWTNARPASGQAHRKSFSRCLKSAWMTAKFEAEKARMTIKQRAADRVEELTRELMRIEARPWKMTTVADRRAIQAEIQALCITTLQ
ncbi:hypothetical protein ELI18_22135 [Rhizobium leguminosarum]|uniref:Uncharacterized protein n=2 Tax=Rhizobium leguminosarum TaxID=384 RepID=A0ABD7PXV9_RHILE|nr:hypothetical protein [Rhizobium leguminosarum]TAW32047.1 hypothetical protein ELI19_22165 [Rhizobium leguminosarum]TAW45778.1 hypothetical protein ELI18_22135 [Rhizobium leguminosarum]